MQNIDVDGQFFEFADNWTVTKIDEWPTYRRHQLSEHKACDLLAFSDDQLVFVEVKDYTYPGSDRPAPPELAKKVAQKVMGSSALLLLFSQGTYGRGSVEERELSQKAAGQKRTIKVVASVELPAHRKRQVASSYLKSLKQHLRRLLVPYCDEIIVDSVEYPASLDWRHYRNPATRSRHL